MCRSIHWNYQNSLNSLTGVSLKVFSALVCPEDEGSLSTEVWLSLGFGHSGGLIGMDDTRGYFAECFILFLYFVHIEIIEV